jgi:transposase
MEFVEVLLESIEHLSRQIALCDKLIAKIVKGNEVCQRLMTVPGVGPITALSVMSSLDEVGRFAGAHAVESYLGLSPGENSSSLRVRKTSITKAGQVYARYALVQAAKSARRCRPSDPMVEWSNAIEERKNSQIATVALARKMAGILFAIWRDGTTYRPSEGARMPEKA